MLIESVKEAYRKNVAAKQRVSGTGMSTNTPQNRQRHDSVDLKGIFEVEEVLVAWSMCECICYCGSCVLRMSLCCVFCTRKVHKLHEYE